MRKRPGVSALSIKIPSGPEYTLKHVSHALQVNFFFPKVLLMGETPNSYCWSVVIVAFSEVVEFESFFGDGVGEEDR